jgi:hypothetical protein
MVNNRVLKGLSSNSMKKLKIKLMRMSEEPVGTAKKLRMLEM